MDNYICKYCQKIFANWCVYWSFMIDKREQFFLFFGIPESQAKKTPTSTTNIRVFFGKEGTEEHDFLEAFNDYRIKLFFASLYLTINKRSGQLFGQFASTYWCCGEFQSFLVIVSRSCRALQNRFWTFCGWAWPFRFLQCQISQHETQFTTWCFKL